ncbi:MAG: VCBS repeat-containing protein [Chloroflexi bacterium]|nr:VCBS repeat-containing protein [Chloroflexota bacterium]
MKHTLFLLFIVLLSACQQVAVNDVTQMPGTIASSPIVTSTKIIITPTPSATKTYTPTPSKTPTQLPPQFFNPADIQTFTPASPAQCPKEDPNLEFDVKQSRELTGSGSLNEHFTKYVLEFLNSGGTMQSILPALNKYYGEQITPSFQIQDVTGDGIQELIYPFGIWMDVFGCKDGKYQLILSDTVGDGSNGVDLVSVTDINQDGLAELVVYFSACLGSRCPSISVYEWNGKKFYDLIENPSYIIFDGCSSLAVAPFEIEIRDIDNNGTKEIILRNNGDVFPDIDFPYRKEARICMWNGKNVVVYKIEFDAPHYRFQAVQDGDRATLAGDYGKALSFYQQTIVNQKLEWFTQDRKFQDFKIYAASHYSSLNNPVPTISPDIVPDPNEYPSLAAYARYRIMLLYVLQNKLPDAEAAYDTLQKEYLFDKPGGYFAQMAFLFWKKYQITQDIKQACDEAVMYAATDPEILLKYLGDFDHGIHSMEYTPESICPFK